MPAQERQTRQCRLAVPVTIPMAKAKYPKKFRQRLEKIVAARDARDMKLESAVRYLGIAVEHALSISEQAEL